MTEGEHLRAIQDSLQQVLDELKLLRQDTQRLLAERHPSIVVTPEDDTGEPIEGQQQ